MEVTSSIKSQIRHYTQRGCQVLGLLPICSLLFSACAKEENRDHIEPEKNGDGRYNILLVTFDQERYLREFPAGSDFKARKYMQTIGTTFERHYATSNVSTASRAGIYTGMHITQTGMLDNTNYPFQPDLDRNLTTVGDRLKEAGYYTAYKGKWHLSKSDRSLDEYGFSDWGTQGDRHGEYQQGDEEDRNIANEAVDWLNQTGIPLNKGGKSFFLAVNFINPHDVMYFNETQDGYLETGFAPDDSVYNKSYPETPIPSTWKEPFDTSTRPSAHGEYRECWERMTGTLPKNEAEWGRFRDYYFNCIQKSDNDMMVLLDLLKEKKMLNNTIVIITADHGEMQGAHGLKGKAGFMYEDNIHVPLVIYHPEHRGGKRCDAITSHLDITPTILDFAGKSTPAELKGYSLLPQVMEPSTPTKRNEEGALFAFSMISMIDGDFIGVPEHVQFRFDIDNRGWVRGIINRQYKFARYYSPIESNSPTTLEALYNNNDVELYAMPSDETINMAMPRSMVASDPDRQALVIEQNRKLNALIGREIGNDDGSEGNFYEGGIMKYAKIRN